MPLSSGANMELTKEQRRLLNLAKHELNSVLKTSTMGKSTAAWALWFAYDAVSNVYHQVRDEALVTYNLTPPAKAKETV